MPGGEQPTWQPLSRLRLIGGMIYEGLADAETQYGLLLEAKHNLHVLDDHTVARTKKVYGETHDDLWVFEEQLARWGRNKKLTTAQRTEIDRLTLELIKFREAVETILALAEELSTRTIEAVLAKSDFDLGLEALFGGTILDGRRPVPGPPAPSPRAAETVRIQRLVLPEGVALVSIPTTYGPPGYAITHPVLGPVGRISIVPVANQCRLDAEVSGPTSDPGFAHRKELVSQVYQELSRILNFAS